MNITQVKRVVDIPNEIFLLQPDAAPLTQVLFKAKKRDCINPKFEWLERDLFPKRDTVGTGAANTTTATTFIVTHGTYFRTYDVIKDETTGEQMLVTAISSNTLTVDRQWGTTTVNTITAAEYIVVLGNSNEEGAGAPGIKSETESEVYNYAQDIRTPFEVTDILANSELYGGKDMDIERKIHLVEHKTDIERALLFGELKEAAGTTHYRRMTDGVLAKISTNVTTMTTATEAAFETFCETAFAYGSSTKLFLGSAKWISALNYWARTALQTVPKDKTYGISVKEYLTGHGTLMVAKHKLLEGTVYGGYGVVIDLDKVWVRTMKNMSTKLKTNIQANDETKEKDEYETVCGLMLTNEKAHAVVKGMGAYS
jgi:hypothetical protein